MIISKNFQEATFFFFIESHLVTVPRSVLFSRPFPFVWKNGLPCVCVCITQVITREVLDSRPLTDSFCEAGGSCDSA